MSHHICDGDVLLAMLCEFRPMLRYLVRVLEKTFFVEQTHANGSDGFAVTVNVGDVVWFHSSIDVNNLLVAHVDDELRPLVVLTGVVTLKFVENVLKSRLDVSFDPKVKCLLTHDILFLILIYYIKETF